jgi:hypothetical protein
VLGADEALAALRKRGDETVDRLLRENEPHWQSLCEADRVTAELLARTVALRLLDQPASRLADESAVGAREHYARALCLMFAVDTGDGSSGLARRSG